MGSLQRCRIKSNEKLQLRSELVLNSYSVLRGRFPAERQSGVAELHVSVMVTSTLQTFSTYADDTQLYLSSCNPTSGGVNRAC